MAKTKTLPQKIRDGRAVLINRLIRDVKAYEHIKIKDPFDPDVQKKRSDLLDLIKKELQIARSMRELEEVEKDLQARGENTEAPNATEQVAEITYLAEARELLKRNKISNDL